ncbi:MAG: threonine synthase [Kurthia gibsonii]|uniref:Threonine synthase n=1 Tax=Kurthia gibsonii TaxID=33946 RepID=A0ABU9LL74_9BACL|nr:MULTISPECIES: threonine synthase [Kurthia]MCA9725409.1 threonine synthase [Kurthia sp.]AMA62277.1 threonine synthase [Kurthia sp. 11kri321]MEB6113632.1 threonine synthase [Kurthia gibsonii]RXH52058.1 threonine synthase [Kurthia gibsonii]HZG11110.1 threonine synthase [Kurthia gibsonii]
MWKGLIEQYKEYLPVTDKTPALTLHEGNTPLIRLNALSEELGIDLHVKYEGLNPTGSFKDRGMVMAVAKAVEDGSKCVICASTGNTSAAAAAYAARAGIQSLVVIPKGKVAAGKLAQAYMYGAKIIEIDGNFDEALQAVRDISETTDVALVNSVNPYRLEGQKTAAFEICDQLGAAPDILAIPVGNAGNISAYWKGFKEYNEKKGTTLPKMFGFEAEGAAAIVQGAPIAKPETIATAIRIGNPASWKLAEAARDESHGKIGAVTDEEILNAYRLIAAKEGIFAEPGSAASVAGVIQSVANGSIPKGSKVVAILTGNGLKDPDTAVSASTISMVSLPNNEEKIREYIEGVL